MSTDKHFSLLASFSENQQQQSGCAMAAENVGSQLMARNLLVSDVLNRSPPLGLKEDVIAQPVRNSWLPNSRPIEEGRNAFGELHLATSDVHGSAKGCNVIRLHDPKYKPANDSVKKAPNMTGNKAPYMLNVVAFIKKSGAVREESRSRRAEELKVWPADDRTANDRFHEAFEEWKAQLPAGRRRRTQKDLERACNVIVGLEEDHEPPYVSQPMISQLLGGQVDASTSALLDVLAEAMGFRSVWIRTGVGERKLPNTERILAALRAAGLSA